MLLSIYIRILWDGFPLGSILNVFFDAVRNGYYFIGLRISYRKIILLETNKVFTFFKRAFKCNSIANAEIL